MVNLPIKARSPRWGRLISTRISRSSIASRLQRSVEDVREPKHSSTYLLLALALGKLLVQFAGINHYGFFRDELYYMACGEHLAWGYVDQPPLIALIAWIVRHSSGYTLFALRLRPAIVGAAVVYLTGRVTRDLGGGLFAQFLAATAILLAPAYLAFY